MKAGKLAERSSAITTARAGGDAARDNARAPQEAGAGRNGPAPQEIFPHALVTAAKTFTTRPEIVGRVLITLVAGDKARGDARAPQEKLTDVERYIIAECEAEIADRRARREAATARKRAQRGAGK